MSETINASKAYEDAAKTWEGDFVFIIHPADKLDHEIRMYIDLYAWKNRPERSWILN